MKKVLIGSLVALGSITGVLNAAQTIPGTAGTLGGVINDETLAYREAFYGPMQKGNFIQSLDPQKIKLWVAIEGVVDDFVAAKGSGDKDLTGPWNTLKQENRMAIKELLEWHSELSGRVAGMGPLAQQAARRLANSEETIDATKKKIDKTLFIRTDKKEVAKAISNFADLLVRVVSRAKKQLMDIK